MTNQIPTRRARLALVAAALIGALSLASCGVPDPAEFVDADDTPDTAETADADASDAETDDADDAPSSAAGGDGAAAHTTGVLSPDDAIATIEYPIPGERWEGTMTVGVHHLRHRGETLELLLSYTPTYTGPEQSLFRMHGAAHARTRPALYDRENLVRYDVMWETDSADLVLASGDTGAFWANFPAPVHEISTINVSLPFGPEFENIPIEQGE